MNRLLRIFASPRLTLAVLGFLVVYSILAAWAPDTPLEKILGPRPFSAPVFLAPVLLLFLCTLSCTWLRTGKVLSLRHGNVPAVHLELRADRRYPLEEFLQEHGFRGKGNTRWRNRPALWAGWLLHLALLLLMVGVVIQLVFHDGGAFEVALGETVSLAESGIVFDRTPGSIAPASPRISASAWSPSTPINTNLASPQIGEAGCRWRQPMDPYETWCSIGQRGRVSKAPLFFRRCRRAWLWFSSWRVTTSAQFTFGPKMNALQRQI